MSGVGCCRRCECACGWGIPGNRTRWIVFIVFITTALAFLAAGFSQDCAWTPMHAFDYDYDEDISCRPQLSAVLSVIGVAALLVAIVPVSVMCCGVKPEGKTSEKEVVLPHVEGGALQAAVDMPPPQFAP